MDCSYSLVLRGLVTICVFQKEINFRCELDLRRCTHFSVRFDTYICLSHHHYNHAIECSSILQDSLVLFLSQPSSTPHSRTQCQQSRICFLSL